MFFQKKTIGLDNKYNTPSLIIVSNRLPFSLIYNKTTNKFEKEAVVGGLVTGILPAVIKTSGYWIGFAGVHLEEYPNMSSIKIMEPGSNEQISVVESELKKEQIVIVNIDKKTYHSYYNTCCNEIFWPLFHSMMDKVVVNLESLEAYKKVNYFFSKKVVETLQKVNVNSKNAIPPPIIWVHDYHLLIVGKLTRNEIKEKNIRCKLGFFLHTPFPPYEIFSMFSQHREILQSMLSYDLISFQTEINAKNFLNCCEKGLNCKNRNGLIEYEGHKVQVQALPIGVPFEYFEQLAMKAPKTNLNKNLCTILGVDRLDYVKGLIHRLYAFEYFLDHRPEFKEKVILLQIIVPSRTQIKAYQTLKIELDELVGRINGKFSTAAWTPIQYIYNFFSQHELAGFYRDVDIVLISSLKDGMNLVAKEFIACQVDVPGVLILSQFTGAAETLHEALLFNPYELNELTNMLHKALTMSIEEKKDRILNMRKREKLYDIDWWVESFLKTMKNISQRSTIIACKDETTSNESNIIPLP